MTPGEPLVELLSLSALPRACPQRQNPSRLPWWWAARLSRQMTLGLAGGGVVRLSWDGFECGEVASREEVRLIDGEGRQGRVLVDRWLALNVVAATLGLPPPKVLRRLGAGERGVLAGHLAALLSFCGGRFAVDLVDARPRDPSVPTVTLALQAEAAGTTGPVSLALSPAWLAAGGGPTPASITSLAKVVGGLETTAAIELAETTLGAGDLAQTRVGDALVFDGCRFLAGSHPERSARLRIGAYEAEVVANSEGVITLRGPFRRARARATAPVGPALVGPAVVKEATTMAGDSEDEDNDDLRAADVLASAPIEVVAELGRLILRGDEVLGLEKGSVLALGHQQGRIDLVIGGRAWARGELVNVDGELGVRITEMVRAWTAGSSSG
jgi:type III secretion system YscQ/HrcQ family protein